MLGSHTGYLDSCVHFFHPPQSGEDAFANKKITRPALGVRFRFESPFCFCSVLSPVTLVPTPPHCLMLRRLREKKNYKLGVRIGSASGNSDKNNHCHFTEDYSIFSFLTLFTYHFPDDLLHLDGFKTI